MSGCFFLPITIPFKKSFRSTIKHKLLTINVLNKLILNELMIFHQGTFALYGLFVIFKPS